MKKRWIALAVGIVVVIGAVFFVYDNYIKGISAGYGAAPDVGDNPLSLIELPEGFSIEEYASAPGARSLALSDSGVLFIGTRAEGNVYAVKDGEVITIASGLDSPNGVALYEGDLYVAEIKRVIKFINIEDNLESPFYQIFNEEFPDDPWHGWKFIKFGPDRLLYVPVGAPCNVCETAGHANIMRMNPDETKPRVFAEGIRNTVGFDWDPLTGEMWFTDNGRDMLGEDIPPDELNHAPTPGMHFGFPYCHGSIQDPSFDSSPCSEFVAPALEFGAHTASLGMEFYTGEMFPSYYKNGIFVAQHGSWNRKVPTGYRVMFVKMVNSTPVSKEIFASGWLQNDKSWGRPVDVEVMKDGSLLVSDDKAGKVYRIWYEP